MSDPFAGYRAGRTTPKIHHANQYLKGQKKRKGRAAPASFGLYMDPELLEWLRDRATMLRVPLTYLICDVLASWRALVISTEDKLGVNLDGERKSISVDDRYPGYAASLVPAAAHTDAAPLGLGDL